MSNNYTGTSTLEVLEGAHRYNKWIFDLISKDLKDPMLEVGAGTGNISELLITKGDLTATDNEKAFVDGLQNKFGDRLNAKVFDITKKPNGEFTNKFNTAVAINVLEHIENDVEAMENIRSTLANNGKFIILVPAKKFAFTSLDKQVGHFRRYEKEELKRKLEDAGFKVSSIRFFNPVGLFSWIVREYISKDKTQLSPIQVKLFDAIVPALKGIEKVISMPVGISLIAVASNEKE
jgi:SAM-dependent methyltransferase